MKTASGTLLFLLLFTRVSSQVTEIQRDSRIYAFNVNSNLSFVGHEFRNHQISNFSTKFLATQCAMECHRTARCQSFNFASKTRQCLLNDATHEDFPEDLANDSSTTGIVYYLKEAISINPDAIGPCGNHPCKNGGRCLDTVSAISGNRTFFCLCQNGWKGGICDIKEESLGWAQWVEWSQCSTTCGNGYHIRQRKCKNLDSGVDLASSQCYGPDTEYKACQFRKCPMWNEWEVWGECSTLNSCGKGSRSRTRTCGNGGKPGVDRYCLGPVNETMACDSVPCSGMVRLRDGEKFGEGRVEMYHSHSKKWMQVCGERWTQRSADTACKQRGFLGAHRVLTNGAYGKSDSLDVVSLECAGSESFLHQCLRVGADQCSVMAGVQCMVRGAWSLWSSWGDCSVTCENGTRTRTRVCNHPPPNFGGRECPDADLEYKPCTMIMCPGIGVWLTWEAWTACSAQCEGGKTSRQRQCDTTRGSCLGSAYQVETCNNFSCSVPGDWMSWSGWSRCSSTCGTGIRWRTRDCNETSYGDLTAPCEGASNGTEDCNTFPCRPYAATCSNLRDMGMVDSGMVQLKPERRDLYSDKPELEPVRLYCDMESEGGIGVTVVGHDKEARTNVNGYEGAGSYLAKVTYEVSTDHVIALIDHSKFCKQFLRWECKGAVIHNPHQKDSWTTFWTNRSSEFNQYNTPATYFPGAKPGSGNCACGDTGTCTNKSLSCNCDSNDFEWRSDEGFVTYKDDLPILAFRAGDTGNGGEEGYLTIGPVLAYGTSD